MSSILTTVAASNCAHVRACLAQFIADGVEDSEAVDNSWWEQSMKRHRKKLFPVEREKALQDILDYSYSFEVPVVVPGS